jgi:hypothetical protein
VAKLHRPHAFSSYCMGGDGHRQGRRRTGLSWTLIARSPESISIVLTRRKTFQYQSEYNSATLPRTNAAQINSNFLVRRRAKAGVSVRTTTESGLSVKATVAGVVLVSTPAT